MAHSLQDMRVPLVASRKSSLNTRNNVVFEHRKSKSSTFDEERSCSVSFDAVILPNTPASKPYTFVPVTTILRAHLPLSWLSGSVTHAIRPGTVLRAHITTVPTWEYHILIARSDPSGVLFALEKVDLDAYVCHPLQNWVSVQWVESAAIGAAPPVHLPLLLESRSENSHSRRPSITSVVNATESSTANSPKLPKNRRGHLARLSILEVKGITEEPLNITNVNDSPISFLQESCLGHHESIPDLTHHIDTQLITTTDCAVPVCLAEVQSEGDCPNHQVSGPADDIVKVADPLSSEHLRGQYLETLYVSKTSLAFYAKGPLSRARARARAPDATRTSADLVEFYKECIIPTKKLDVKYKDSLLSKISSIAAGAERNAEHVPERPRKSKRVRVGKDGLWPLEDEYISRWWRNQEHMTSSQRTPEGELPKLKKLVSHLRSRETEMHIIIILEILALQDRDASLAEQPSTTLLSESEVKIESIEGIDSPLVPKASATRKPRDLKAELDFLIDRLCIWQSVGFEDTAESTNVMQAPDSSSQRLKDRLHDFCKDVIVPFYGGKLPEQCHAICKKLGGTEFSPHRSKRASEQEPSKATPGAIIPQERASNKRKHQTITSKVGNTAPPPLLLRSATLPIAVTSKRETSERPMSRGAMQKSVSFSNREVDLVADARATAAKRRKLDLVTAQKRELNAAIETMKRPNRNVVAKSFMDDVERRVSDTRSAVKKVEPVQIIATPKRGGTRRVPADEYDLPPIPQAVTMQEASLIPSSTAKPRGLALVSGDSRSSTMKRAVLSAIHDTPSRATSKTGGLNASNYGGGINRPQGPVRGSSSAMVASTPTTLRTRDDIDVDVAETPMRMKKSLRTVLFTPVTKSDVNIERAFKDAPVIPEQAGKMMDRVMGSKTDVGEMSLYESLGWDDDYDL